MRGEDRVGRNWRSQRQVGEEQKRNLQKMCEEMGQVWDGASLP